MTLKLHEDPSPVRAAILARVANSSSRLIALGNKPDHDARLLELQKGSGQLAVMIQNRHPYVFQLERIAAFAIGWAEQIVGTSNQGEVIVKVHIERERQLSLLKKGKLHFCCSSSVVDPARKFRVLTEEIGEVAQEIDHFEKLPTDFYRSRLFVELIQVAAVAVGWLESLETAMEVKS